MWLKFSKMHGLGNDFMVIDLVTQAGHIRPDRVRELADRNFGVGFDQLLIVEQPSRADVDFRYRIFNADGSEVENCGNGARCFARFVYDQRLTGKRDIRVETASGLMELHLTDDRQVVVDMGNPVLDPKLIPFEAAEFSPEYTVQIEGIGEVKLGAVSMGNPHAVLRVDDIDTAPVESWGPLIEPHPVFPRKVNVGFMQVIDEHNIRLRVFERGAGETLACGTGACAAVVSGQLRGWLKPGVNVRLPGGDLFIEWDGESSVKMTGPAETVFEGRMNI
ncbi:MAG: diaminopimelate epimerase [Oceanospirillaceae bacterium]|uniref:diaminopimelate epimerase n=1 Tax=unclassified Thalassolituus TaxID=2624967 RepID=UPI000C0B4AA5|nr:MULTISPECIES: diaminopimelate epimerase [unclassified Thalassolituus]MAK92188.1 diaminopimelate epimerase [Thalassolituus sp.]MAS26088.1 diaminopimelate epimerase [Oceanospirillaceae bacterium]MAY01059.1 diaminopimelate epimerase [Oceanospirillaceae bacterium]MBL36555.1 diaminopimelate epimerase [Oceanospirillaceae bacterium]MBS53377.1 diaminopimelate epimerase [Oceanospirillaceae bacterium]|tara:strand:- start:4153 stop:4983 length:831 start_codon:yes stop_codon:yes gene_type:complete